ncbi:hypothetical protein ACFX2A_044254 [Malus domestica]
MKNHQARPTGATVVPEAHYSNHQRQNAKWGVVRAARSHPTKVNKVKAHPREETKTRSTQTSLPRPQTSRIKAKHLKPWMQTCAIIVVQRTIGPVFAELPKRL